MYKNVQLAYFLYKCRVPGLVGLIIIFLIPGTPGLRGPWILYVVPVSDFGNEARSNDVGGMYCINQEKYASWLVVINYSHGY